MIEDDTERPLQLKNNIKEESTAERWDERWAGREGLGDRGKVLEVPGVESSDGQWTRRLQIVLNHSVPLGVCAPLKPSTAFRGKKEITPVGR